MSSYVGAELGAYRLGKQLASSAISETFVATSTTSSGEKQVVLERLMDQASKTTIAHFIEDARVALRLAHPNILQTVDMGTDGPYYVAREYVEGIGLLGLLREHARAKRAIDPAVAVWVAIELLAALEHVPHVHGRISMSNVRLGTGGEVKLGGFGALRPFELGGPLAELGYVSPEYLNGQPLDGRSDVFVVGILLAELVMGRRLFLAGHELDVLVMVRDIQLDRFDASTREADKALVEIVRSVLRKAQAERPSVVELRESLSAWLKARECESLTKELAATVAFACKSREEHPDRRVPDIDVLFGRASSSPPIPATPRTTKPMPGAVPPRRTPPKGVPTVVTIPDRPVPPVRKTALGTAVTATPSTGTPVVEAPPPLPAAEPVKRVTRERLRSETDFSELSETDAAPLPDSAVPEPVGAMSSRPSSTSLGMPPLREPGLQLELEVSPVHGSPTVAPPAENPFAASKEEDTFVGIPAPREPAIQAKPGDVLALGKDEIAAALAIHESLIVDVERVPDQAGTLSETSPLRLLFHLMAARATGLVAVARGSVKTTLHLRDGQPQTMWSSESADLFGDYLVARNVLTEEQLAKVLKARRPGRLADTLTELRLINPIVALKHLNRHIAMRVLDLCTWRTGAFGWFSGKQDPRAAFPIEGDSIAMLGEAALALDDEIMNSWLGANGRTKPRPARAPKVPADRFGVSGLADILDELDGFRTIDQLLTREPDRIERARIARMVHLLVVCGLAVT